MGKKLQTQLGPCIDHRMFTKLSTQDLKQSDTSHSNQQEQTIQVYNFDRKNYTFQ